MKNLFHLLYTLCSGSPPGGTFSASPTQRDETLVLKWSHHSVSKYSVYCNHWRRAAHVRTETNDKLCDALTESTERRIARHMQCDRYKGCRATRATVAAISSHSRDEGIDCTVSRAAVGINQWMLSPGWCDKKCQMKQELVQTRQTWSPSIRPWVHFFCLENGQKVSLEKWSRQEFIKRCELNVAHVVSCWKWGFTAWSQCFHVSGRKIT